MQYLDKTLKGQKLEAYEYHDQNYIIYIKKVTNNK